MSRKTRKRSAVLDGVRVLATACVVAFHFAQLRNLPGSGGIVIPHWYYISLGNVGVTLFIVLSGCLLAQRPLSASNSTRAFFVSRLQRLLPTYWTALAGAVGVLLVRTLAFPSSILPDTLAVALHPTNLMCSITATCAFFGFWGGALIHTSWFVGVIFSLYLFFPQFRRWLERWPASTLIFSLILTLLSRFLVTHTQLLKTDPLEWFPPARLFEFVLGMWIGTRPSLQKLWEVSSPKWLLWLGELSFPTILIHLELQFFIPWLMFRGWSPLSASVVYAFFVVLGSWMVWRLSKAWNLSANRALWK